MLRIYFLQQWFNLSDPAVEEALYDLAGDAASLVGIDLGQELRHRTKIHGVQVSGTCWKNIDLGKRFWARSICTCKPWGSAHHHRYDRGRNHSARAHVDQEPRAAARSGDAPDQERQSVVLRK